MGASYGEWRCRYRHLRFDQFDRFRSARFEQLITALLLD